ncbi:MAG: amidohydrolase family protein [Nitrososphaera sp.]|jgi:cytosine/adenosine deaminase-related metal-dependent hydrolase
MLIRNVSLLHGKKLTYVDSTNIRIIGEYITEVGSALTPKNNEQTIDACGLLMMPGLINSHTHIGDSIAKDIGIDSDVETKIHPIFGFKQKILQNSGASHLISFMKSSCFSMIKKGITTFVDFREGGIEGSRILRDATSGIPIRSIILGRIEYYQDLKSIRKNIPLPDTKKSLLDELLQISDGIGISGANEFSNSTLKDFSKTKKLRAIHSSETEESVKLSQKITSKTETQRALLTKPNFLVHMTYASKKDLQLAVRNNSSIVVCPRANGSLAEGIPDVDLMLKSGCNIGIGTDNVMINSPDIFREMDYLWKVSMGMKKKRISPIDILKMATVNASNYLGGKIGIIEKNKIADCIFIEKHSIDLEPMHNPYAAIVQRVSENTIKAVMFAGEIVYGKI